MDTSDPLPVLDRAEGLRRVRGNEKLYRELASCLLGDLPRLTGLLRTALDMRSAKELHYAAHCLKGSASHLGAVAVERRAWTLEKMGRDGDLTDAPQHFLLLERDLHELNLVLQSLTSEGQIDT